MVVDVQNDFTDPRGALAVPGGTEVLRVVNELVDSASAAGVPVLYTQDWHPPDTPHFVKDGGPWPVHCVRGTWGAELHPALHVRGAIVRKGTNGEDGYSGFTMEDPRSRELISTGLAEQLRDQHVQRVVVVGLATDHCVKATALDGVRLGFDVVVVDEAVAAVDVAPGDGERALATMAAAGVSVR